VHVALDLLARRLVDERPDVGPLLPAVAQLERGDALGEVGEEVVVDAALEDEAARRGAALTGRSERAPEHPLKGEIEVGVVEDDLRVLSAHLERQALVHAPARLTNDA